MASKMFSKSANSKNKLKRNHFKSASRARSEECIWEIEDKARNNFLSASLRQHEITTDSKRKKSHLVGREIVRIITRDGVRDLLVSNKTPNSQTVFWPEQELSRLQANSKVMTVEDKMQELKLSVQKNEKLKEQSEQRKQKLKEIDTAKVSKMEDQKEPLISDDNENIKLLDRAFLAKQEQEEEVKKANRIILATKCSIIRDAQIAEKNEIAREFRNENLRLEKIMLEERDKALVEEELKREQERTNLLKYSKEIRKQLEERELIRAKEVERIEEEAIAMKKALDVMEKQEQEKTKIRNEKIQKIREGLQKSSQWTQYFKNLQFEEERIAELKVQEYMRQKLEREKRLALERRLAKEEKEKEYERILQRQQKLTESKSERNELEYRRQREEVEREFRRREKEAAIKKREMADDIAKARHVQLEEVKRQRAMQIARDEANFKEFMEKLRIEKDREEQRKKLRHENKYKYRDEIVSQMTQKRLKKREEDERIKREQLAVVEAERQREK
ncbi:CLUMA_CG012850, isoform A [Clunio marinus]|uniref:Cilia- and flagella-associated protein 45 n=1 Tax=Clunio marinus TaxID=568069 RepID=A0A1J1IH34_9DIPT|nr:CLUMA_CG012850, isoform A [Clunio marinus]